MSVGDRRSRFYSFQDFGELRWVRSKLTVKRFLSQRGVCVPATVCVVGEPVVSSFIDTLPDAFAVKPETGAMGGGVMVLARSGDAFVEPDGRASTGEDIIRHVNSILRTNVEVLIEERINPHPELAALSPYGTMPDFRFYFARGRLLFAMMRVPTKKSRGYGNLARGALSLVATPDGVIGVSPCWTAGTVHPETGVDYDGVRVPVWDIMLPQVCKVPPLFKGRFVGVDGTLDTVGRFIVPEVTLSPSFATFLGWDYLLSELEKI